MADPYGESMEDAMGASETDSSAAAVPAHVFWSALAASLAVQRQKARLYLYEAVFAGSALLFMYLAAFSPPSQRLNLVDLLIITVIVACTLAVAAYYRRAAIDASRQLEMAVKQIGYDDSAPFASQD